MPNDRTNNGTPYQELPEVTGRVKPVPINGGTLASRLVPVVDKIRQLYTNFGVRPYRVFMVHVQWSGDRIGDGVPRELSRREILPTPRVGDISGTTEMLRASGLTEEGGISVDQISAKYTEDDLLGRTPDLQDPAMPRTGLRQMEFYWEVVENRPSSPTPVRRDYAPSTAPALSRDGFQWRVNLAKRVFDRARDGGWNRRSV